MADKSDVHAFNGSQKTSTTFVRIADDGTVILSQNVSSAQLQHANDPEHNKIVKVMPDGNVFLTEQVMTPHPERDKVSYDATKKETTVSFDGLETDTLTGSALKPELAAEARLLAAKILGKASSKKDKDGAISDPETVEVGAFITKAYAQIPTPTKKHETRDGR